MYWPFALESERMESAAGWLTAALQDLGIPAQIETWHHLRSRTPGALQAATDLLSVGGGNTFRLLAHLRERGDLVAHGCSYYGGGAGALLAWLMSNRPSGLTGTRTG